MKSEQHIARDEIFIHAGALLAAMASPIRLRIIQILSNKACSVEEIALKTEEKIGNISQHLQRLSKAHLVRYSKIATSRVYELSSDSVLKLWIELQEIAGGLSPEIREYKKVVCPEELCSPKPLSEIIRQVSSKKAVLIDVRDLEETEYQGVAGALSIPVKSMKAETVKLPRSKTIYLFCRGRYCSLANSAVGDLRAQGFKAYRLRESVFEINQFAQ